MTEPLIHWTWDVKGRARAWCYWYYAEPLLTDDPFKVTCGKCQRSKVVKAAAATAF